MAKETPPRITRILVDGDSFPSALRKVIARYSTLLAPPQGGDGGEGDSERAHPVVRTPANQHPPHPWGHRNPQPRQRPRNHSRYLFDRSNHHPRPAVGRTPGRGGGNHYRPVRARTHRHQPIRPPRPQYRRPAPRGTATGRPAPPSPRFHQPPPATARQLTPLARASA